MNKGLDALVWMTTGIINKEEWKECYNIIEQELTLLQDLLGHVTDLYMKKELDYYADREPFYYDYYIVFDTTPLKVSKELYDEVRKQLDLPNKCVDW